MSSGARDPGWYVDPDEPRRYRFWDGHVWLSEKEALRAAGETAEADEGS